MGFPSGFLFVLVNVSVVTNKKNCDIFIFLEFNVRKLSKEYAYRSILLDEKTDKLFVGGM